jgi:uncharacterized protein (DUF3084 family)
MALLLAPIIGAIDVRPAITVAVIVLIAGFVAYVGDRVGHQVGRRRLTLFGLRPRYTSTIFAVGFGMMIALLAIGFVALINEQARQALFSINTLRDDIRSLTTQREELLRFMREEPLVFRNGEAISRPVVVTTTDLEDVIARNLEELFLVVADHYSHIPDVKPYPKALTPAERTKIAVLAKQIKGFAPDDAIVVPVAGENIFRHGALVISFDVYKDRLIYRKGETIASVGIANGNNAQLAGAALQQLRIAITDNAINHGMPPSIADTPDASVEGFAGAYKQLSAINGPVVLQAIAARDVLARGPLTTELKVAPGR